MQTAHLSLPPTKALRLYTPRKNQTRKHPQSIFHYVCVVAYNKTCQHFFIIQSIVLLALAYSASILVHVLLKRCEQQGRHTKTNKQNHCLPRGCVTQRYADYLPVCGWCGCLRALFVDKLAGSTIGNPAGGSACDRYGKEEAESTKVPGTKLNM